MLSTETTVFAFHIPVSSTVRMTAAISGFENLSLQTICVSGGELLASRM